MKCKLCNDTGLYKKPNDQEEFDRIVDTEMDKGYFVSETQAEEKAYKQVGFTLIDCPNCGKRD